MSAFSAFCILAIVGAIGAGLTYLYEKNNPVELSDRNRKHGSDGGPFFAGGDGGGGTCSGGGDGGGGSC